MEKTISEIIDDILDAEFWWEYHQAEDNEHDE